MTETTIQKIQRLARERKHRIDPRQLDGSRTLAPAQAEAILRNLERCDPLDDQPVSRETAGRGPVAAERPAQRGRPGPRITEPGCYLNHGRVFLAYLSQYGDRGLRVKVLDPKAVNPRTGRPGTWSAMPAARGFLRAEDRMTEDQSREYEQSYGIAVCIDCGLPLETDESRARRKGPVCANK